MLDLALVPLHLCGAIADDVVLANSSNVILSYPGDVSTRECEFSQ